jgi:hypothetical protein
MGDRFTLDAEYLYFDVPEGTHRAIVSLNASRAVGINAVMGGDLMLVYGNMPIQVQSHHKECCRS